MQVNRDVFFFWRAILQIKWFFIEGQIWNSCPFGCFVNKVSGPIGLGYDACSVTLRILQCILRTPKSLIRKTSWFLFKLIFHKLIWFLNIFIPTVIYYCPLSNNSTDHTSGNLFMTCTVIFTVESFMFESNYSFSLQCVFVSVLYFKLYFSI